MAYRGSAYYGARSKCAGGVDLPRNGGPCPECGARAGETCQRLVAALSAENARLRAALTECAAGWSSSPGTVMDAAAELGREFKRRMQIAGEAINEQHVEETK